MASHRCIYLAADFTRLLRSFELQSRSNAKSTAHRSCDANARDAIRMQEIAG
jgi:hypothetical protein